MLAHPTPRGAREDLPHPGGAVGITLDDADQQQPHVPRVAGSATAAASCCRACVARVVATPLRLLS